MRGGVVSRIESGDINEHILRILRGSTYEYIQRGTYGFVFKITFPGNSGFINYETGEPVNVFVLKVQSIDMEMLINLSRGDEAEIDEEGIPFHSARINWRDLLNEVRLQKILYETGLRDYGIAPCPAILFYKKITIEELESYITGKFKYRNEDPIVEKDYPSYHVGIILMEYVSATDLLRLDQERYQQEIKNKAFTSYCLALKCGIDQVDAFPQNFLLDKDGKMTIIDFGIATRVRDYKTKPLIEHAEETGEYDALIEHLRTNNPKLNRWLLPDNNARFEPITPLTTEVVSRCLTGLFKCEESWCSIMGGKRRSKKKRKKLKRLSLRY